MCSMLNEIIQNDTLYPMKNGFKYRKPKEHDAGTFKTT